MESLKRGRHLLSSSDDDEEEEEENHKRSCLASSDPLEWIPGQVFVQVLLDSQFDLSTTAWVLVRVSRRWKDTILRHLASRWKTPDVYHPFLWSNDPSLSGGLIPPMDPLLKEWGRQGWLGLLQWAHGMGLPLLHPDDETCISRHTLLAAACEVGHQPMVAWVLDDLGGYLDERKAIEGACRSGNDALLRWLVEERHVDPSIHIPFDENPASRGNLEMCQWLVWHCSSHFWLSGAGRNDHRHILEWAISEGHTVNGLVWPECCCVWLTVTAYTPQAIGAAAAGRLDTLEWLWGRLGDNPAARAWTEAFYSAARAGNLATMEWLLDRGCRCPEFSALTAVQHGHVDIADLLWKRGGFGLIRSTRIVRESGYSGSLRMLQWAIHHNLTLTEGACKEAARAGHLDALRFLRSHHCPWDGDTVRNAVYSGHLDILQWALANGCPLGSMDRTFFLRYCPDHPPGLRRWIEECWPEEPREVKE